MRLFVLRSILVASDLGDASLPAMRTGAELARLTDARLHLLHVAETPSPDGEARLRDHARRAAPDDREFASVRVLSGAPGAAIAEHAARVDADVVVLGAHRGRRSSGALGATSTAVVDAVACPCLVIGGEFRLPIERVLAPVDLSEASSGSLAIALTWASALRRPNDEAELIVLHVLAGRGTEAAAEGLHRAGEQVRKWAGSAASVRVRELLSTSADPASEILHRASADAADLLVMATGATAVGRNSAELRVGRVSSAVARAAARPVLLVPPPVWRDTGRSMGDGSRTREASG